MTPHCLMLQCMRAGGIAEGYDEDEDEDGYVTEDSVDPDNMTYEVTNLPNPRVCY